jgi:hypothetical protein
LLPTGTTIELVQGFSAVVASPGEVEALISNSNVVGVVNNAPAQVAYVTDC